MEFAELQRPPPEGGESIFGKEAVSEGKFVREPGILKGSGPEKGKRKGVLSLLKVSLS